LVWKGRTRSSLLPQILGLLYGVHADDLQNATKAFFNLLWEFLRLLVKSFGQAPKLPWQATLR